MSETMQVETNKACGGDGYTSTWRAIGFAINRAGMIESIDHAFGEQWPEGPEAIVTLDEQFALRALQEGRELDDAPRTCAAYIVEVCYRRHHADGYVDQIGLPRWELSEAYQILDVPSLAAQRLPVEDQAVHTAEVLIAASDYGRLWSESRGFRQYAQRDSEGNIALWEAPDTVPDNM